ncbi:NAD(P)H-hydrate epimerase [Roseiflexus castenholzii]|uniref:Bifunctional NAD(P)H-hydrate repair enzyme n=1 Tax=Roseiflexus castenholzii (strain DSM 13941 / HLO8) TaxID=383372 RepID=A7NJE2_ROSCS|nr:NAD(P)H-hydrate epimerase [Roseiflexus castenholzii]ABU57612.1 carbohydrate kinase, YjeF related protein [Roseiflexus castenholzii DSM 13941]
MSKIVTAGEMRAIEEAAVARGATWSGLMEQAGTGVARVAREAIGNPAGRCALVLVGPGNNGGDGLVAARLLHDAGVKVMLYFWRRQETSTDGNWRLCRERAISEVRAADDPQSQALRRALAESDLVIDALLGYGANRPVEGELATIIATLNMVTAQRDRSARPFVLAVDVPTGVHADSGALLGNAVCADLTVSTGPLKRGLVFYPARAYAGELCSVDIGLSPADLEGIMTELIDGDLARSLLPPRPPDSHKGTFGKALVVAGSVHYPGAASLASAGAARVGAGLVTLAVGRSQLVGPGRIPEVTLHPLPEAEWGVLGDAAADEMLAILGDYQALLVGPGLGREKATRAFFERLLGLQSPRHRGQIGFRIATAGSEKAAVKQRPELPFTVIDADGLNILADLIHHPEPSNAAFGAVWDRLPMGRCVLTPHPGEMRRLLGVEQIAEHPVDVAKDAAARWKQIVVLKGATTVIADPEGRVRVNDGGNPALATAGTGDVLAGAIAGLLAQGLKPFDAATLGVYLHSAAGRLVRDELGDMGTLAGDLLPRLPLAIRALKQS